MISTKIRSFVARFFGGASKARLPRIAVLIDADYVNQSGIQHVFDQLNRAWNPIYWPAYGRGLASRADVLRRHGILAVEVVSNSPGKNAADMALVIDAMAELHTHRVDAFCLVTGDGDFTRLVTAIRERGFPVLGFGADSTPAFLRAACSEFHVLENAGGSRVKTTRRAGAQRESKKPVRDREEFRQFIHSHTQGSGKATLRRINREACKRDGSFSPRQYGATSLKSLIRDFTGFVVRPIADNSGVIRDY